VPELNPRELLHEWRQLMDGVIASAAATTGRTDLPGDLLGAMQRQLELVQELVERERRLQGELAGRLLGPVDAVFDLLEDAGATMRGQAEALQAAGRALEDSAGLMKLAKVATGTRRRASKGERRKPRS
jgi:hypothetical protein